MATWQRLELLAIPAPGKMMATAAKKHLTVFYKHKPRTPPGRLDVKNAFATAAAKTLDEPIRATRNAAVKAAMEAAHVKTGVYLKKSKGRGPKLSGRVYVLSKGETVSGAMRRAGGLSGILR